MCLHGLAAINLRSKSHESVMSQNLRSNTLVWMRVTFPALQKLTDWRAACVWQMGLYTSFMFGKLSADFMHEKHCIKKKHLSNGWICVSTLIITFCLDFLGQLCH